MMISGDFDMNQVQRYTNSLKEVLKQKMVNQDVMFKNQVHELHRLCRFQESLMKNSGWEECIRYNSWNQHVQSSLLPYTDPTRYDPLAQQSWFPSTAKVSSTHFQSHELPRDCYKLRHRTLDLQLSADEFINHAEEELPKKPNVWNFFEDFPLSSGNSSNAEEMKLSLSIDRDGNKMSDFFPKKTFFSSCNTIIDLEEESVDMTSDGYAKSRPSHNFDFLGTNSKGKREFQAFTFSEPFLPDNTTFQEYTECCQGQNSSGEGARESHDKVASNDQQLTPYRRKLDLNKIHMDDSSCFSDDHNTVNLSLMDLNRNIMNTDTCPESMPRSPVGISEGLASCSGDNKNDTFEQKSKLNREVSCKKSEVEKALFPCSDQSQSTSQGGQGNKSPSSCISDNDSSSGKSTRSTITYDVPNHYTETQLGSQANDQNECYNKKEESAEMDISIHEAAESLIHISSVIQVGSKKREQPEYSFDSFELIAFNLTESNVDEDSVTSKPFEVNTEAKDFGVKLRRGRRMKDFQKEILPSLASLSRHEILEDVNIMEGVLRSTEYRRNRAKMGGCGEKWLAPVRSRRSRVNYGGRRNFS